MWCITLSFFIKTKIYPIFEWSILSPQFKRKLINICYGILHAEADINTIKICTELHWIDLDLDFDALNCLLGLRVNGCPDRCQLRRLGCTNHAVSCTQVYWKYGSTLCRGNDEKGLPRIWIALINNRKKWRHNIVTNGGAEAFCHFSTHCHRPTEWMEGRTDKASYRVAC